MLGWLCSFLSSELSSVRTLSVGPSSVFHEVTGVVAVILAWRHTVCNYITLFVLYLLTCVIQPGWLFLHPYLLPFDLVVALCTMELGS